MGPSSNEIPAMNLPPPVGDHEPAAAEHQPSMEQAPTPPETSLQAPQLVPAAPPIPLPTQPVAGAGLPSNVASTTGAASATGADDSELIEKEWVNKAKAIVERTREDPYKQTEELTVVKADYMKQRYDKTIKTDK